MKSSEQEQKEAESKPFVAVLLPFIPTMDNHGKITNKDHKVLFKDAEKRIKFLKNTHKYDVHGTVLLLPNPLDIASVYERLKETDAKLEIIAHGTKESIGSFSPGPSVTPKELAAEFDAKFQAESTHHKKIKCTISILACNSATGKHSYAEKFLRAMHHLKYTHITVDGINGYITTNGGKQFVCDENVLPSTPVDAIRQRSLEESKITYRRAKEECRESSPSAAVRALDHAASSTYFSTKTIKERKKFIEDYRREMASRLEESDSSAPNAITIPKEQPPKGQHEAENIPQLSASAHAAPKKPFVERIRRPIDSSLSKD